MVEQIVYCSVGNGSDVGVTHDGEAYCVTFADGQRPYTSVDVGAVRVRLGMEMEIGACVPQSVIDALEAEIKSREAVNPLEVMAKAFWEAHREDVPAWGRLDEASRLDDMRRMRAALLALAEAELPEDTMQAGGFAMDDLDEKAVLAFRAMLRSIANQAGDA